MSVQCKELQFVSHQQESLELEEPPSFALLEPAVCLMLSAGYHDDVL